MWSQNHKAINAGGGGGNLRKKEQKWSFVISREDVSDAKHEDKICKYIHKMVFTPIILLIKLQILFSPT